MNAEGIELRQVFAKRFKTRRLAMGLSQGQLAKQLHVEVQNVGRWESGIRVPGTENIILMASVLQCSTDYLLGCSVMVCRAEGVNAMTEQWKKGDRVWYEPSEGMRFAGVYHSPCEREGEARVFMCAEYTLWKDGNCTLNFFSFIAEESLTKRTEPKNFDAVYTERTGHEFK